MNTSTSNLLHSAAFKLPARMDGSAPGLPRAAQTGAQSGEQFSQLMKSYGGGQPTQQAPQVDMQSAPTEKGAKPAPAPAVRPPQEGKTEQQRQEAKLAQKKSAQTNETKVRAPIHAQAPKSAPTASETPQMAKPALASPGDTDRAGPAKTKTGELKAELGSADAAAAAAAQQVPVATLLLAATGSTALDTAPDPTLPGQDEAQSTNSTAKLGPLTEAASSKAGPGFANVKEEVGATAVASNQPRSPLHPHLGAAPQAKQPLASSTAELASSSAPNFGRELQTAQGMLGNAGAVQTAPKSEGFSIEGLMSAGGLVAPSLLEARSEATAARQVTIAQPLSEPGFAPEMAARLSVLAADGVQEARLHLNPAEMGPVTVQIIVEGQQAQVSFHAEHEQTRAVLEQSLPDLAAALRDSGLTLSGGGVFQQAGDQNRSAQQEPDTAAGRGPNQAQSLVLGASNPAPALQTRPSRGVVDLYA
jgi:flagellar hook-length control protein FliK